jgi:hypothetical protein
MKSVMLKIPFAVVTRYYNSYSRAKESEPYE